MCIDCWLSFIFAYTDLLHQLLYLSPAVSIAVVQLSVYMLSQKSIKFININKLNDLHELVFWTIKILKITLPEYFIISMSISYAINCE